MNRLIYVLFLSVFFFDFFYSKLGLIPRPLTWLPDFLALVITLMILFRFAVVKYYDLEAKYVYLILMYMVIVVCGIIYNNVSPFKAFVGIRFHMKHLPFFLLPAFYRFTEDDFKKQLLFIVPLLLLQTPVAIFQKLYTYFSLKMSTGDAVQGTLTSADTIAVVVLCGIAVLFSFYLKRQISLRMFLVMSICLFIPTTICESKATVFYLPIVLIVPSFLCEDYMKGKRKRNLFVASIVWLMGMAIFIPMYKVIVSPLSKGQNNLSDVASPGYLTGYMFTGISEKRFLRITALALKSHVKDYVIGSNVRRVDQVVLAYDHLSNQSTMNLLTGEGIGMTIQSYLDSASKDAKPKLKDLLPRTADITFSILLWEVGLCGLIVYVIFLFVLFKDSRLVSESKDLFGVFSLGWCSTILVIFMTMGYFNMERYNSINILFWYFSGIVAARATRLRRLNEVSCCTGLYRHGSLAPGHDSI